MESLDQKVVVVTGAARGIGLATVALAARRGARIGALDISADGARAAAELARNAGADALDVDCDVSSPDALADAVSRLSDRFGRVDILINNAAAQQFGAGGVERIEAERWIASYEVNVLGSARMTSLCLPLLAKSKRGHVINTASSLAIRPNAVTQHLMPYVASKGALVTFTYALAFALQKLDIDVSLFCPGLTAAEEGMRTKPEEMGWFRDVADELKRPRSYEHAARTLLDGISDKRFLISSDVGIEAAIRRFADNALDPLSDFN